MVFQLNLKLLPTCENYKTFTGSEKQIIAWFVRDIYAVILLHEKLLQFDWLRAMVFQLNLKYLHVKIINLLRVVV